MATIHETKDGNFVKDFIDPAQPNLVPLSTTLGRLQAAQGDPHLVIHLHGGLVSTPKGRAKAERLAKPLPDGFADDAYEQMSIVWGSGAFETVITNFRELANERLFDRALKKLMIWVSRRVLDLGTGTRSANQGLVPQQVEMVVNQAKTDLDNPAGAEPFPIPGLPPEQIVEPGGPADANAEDELSDLLSSDNELLQISTALDAVLRPDQFESVRAGIPNNLRSSMEETKDKLDPDFLQTYEEELAAAPVQTRSAAGTIALRTIIKQSFKAGKAVVRRYLHGRHHDAYPTVFEELARHLYVGTIGSQVWAFMKNDTADHFKPDGAGTSLLQQLSALNAGLDGGRELRVTLLGHSAGSIFASEFLKAIAAPANAYNLPPVDVIFLAPAVDFPHFADALDTAEQQIRRFHMYTMDDQHEKEDRMLGAFYPRSLLYLISGALEFSEADDPIVGMDRFHRVNDGDRTYTASEQVALTRVRDFLSGPKAESIWSVTGDTPPPGATTATKHGGFDTDEKTLQSIVHLAKAQ